MAELINLTPKWEYKSESAVSMDRMNELGAEGWELASYNVYYDREVCAMKNIAIFKRVRYEQTDVKPKPRVQESEFKGPAAEYVAKYGNTELYKLELDLPGLPYFPVRILNSLMYVGIRTLNDLLRISRNSLKQPKGMGPKSIKFLDEYYKHYGLYYGEEVLLPDPDKKIGGGFMAYKLPPQGND